MTRLKETCYALGNYCLTVLWGGVGFAEERVADAQKEADPVQKN